MIDTTDIKCDHCHGSSDDRVIYLIGTAHICGECLQYLRSLGPEHVKRVQENLNIVPALEYLNAGRPSA